MNAVQVESEGPYAPEELLPEAILVLRAKIGAVRKAVASIQSDLSEDQMDTQ
jgi:DNA-directed RNA polymerases I and III subunit RPAC1